MSIKKGIRTINKRAKSVYHKGYKVSHHEAEEFGPGKTGIVMCPSCSAVYYNKSWHHSMLHYDELNESKQVAFLLCPACAMWKNHQWEGELRIDEAPRQFEEQIRNTILSVANEAYRRDPMDRVFDIKKKGRKWIVYTSENQLAHRIALKIASSLKNHFSKPKTHHGKGEDVFLVTMQWIAS